MNKCDCGQGQLTDFCIFQDCQLNRRLCVNCMDEHKNHKQYIIRYEKKDSFDCYAINKQKEYSKNILISSKHAKEITSKAFQKIITKYDKIKEQLKDKFAYQIFKPLETLEGTTQLTLIQQKKQIIADTSCSKREQTYIARQMNQLMKKDKLFTNKNCITEITTMITQQFKEMRLNIQKLLQQISNEIKKMEQFSPYNKQIEEILRLRKIKKQQERLQNQVIRQTFLKKIKAKIIDEDNCQTLEKWQNKHKFSLQNIPGLDLGQRIFQNIPQQITMFPVLVQLNLIQNQIVKIQNLDKCTKLQRLSLGGNRLVKIQGLETLVNLKVLFLDWNKIKKVENIECLVNLVHINLDHNDISQIVCLQFLKKIPFYSIFGSPISDSLQLKK